MGDSWFKCDPATWLRGMEGLTIEEQAWYTQIIMRMYDTGRPISAPDKTIARWCDSNVRRWLRVKESLVEKGKIIELPDHGIVDEKVIETISDRVHGSGKVSSKFIEEFTEIERALSQVSGKFRESLAKDSGKIRERFGKHDASFAKDSGNIRETSSENPIKSKGLKQMLDVKIKKEEKDAIALALNRLRDGCKSDPEIATFDQLVGCVSGGDENTIILNSPFMADVANERLRRPLRIAEVELEVSRVLPS